MTEADAVYAFLAAFAVAALLTPLTARLARRVGAVDQPKRARARRGVDAAARRPGDARRASSLSSALFLDFGGATSDRLKGILAGAVVIAFVGALDDRFDLPPAVKLAGQIVAAAIPVAAGVEVTNITLPFVGAVNFGDAGGPLTVAGLVAVMNVVNLSDGVDGLAAGRLRDQRDHLLDHRLRPRPQPRRRSSRPSRPAPRSASSIHNFHPASVYMGDCGSNLLGLLLGCIAVEGAVKTQAVLALLFPLVVLAVPFLDTTFVVLKRMKYRRPIYRADANHFHHRLSRIGFSQRRTVLYLYAWTILLGGFAVALRFVPYSDHHGHFHTGWTLADGRRSACS